MKLRLKNQLFLPIYTIHFFLLFSAFVNPQIGNAQEWSVVGKGIQSQLINQHNTIHSLVVYKDELYAGGTFTEAGGVHANRIAKWNGTMWSAVNEGMNGSVYAMCVYKDELYLGGAFTQAWGQTVNYIAKWNGEKWSTVGEGFDGTVLTLAVFKDELYAAGNFSMSGKILTQSIAKWNGTIWSALGKGVDPVVNMGVYQNELYVGGYAFNQPKGLSRWNGTTWLKPSYDLYGLPNSFAEYKNDLYMGGFFPGKGKDADDFSKKGKREKKWACLKRWNGKSWLDIGAKGPNGHVHSLLVFEDELYAGGFFDTVDSTPANNFAKWNGTYWTALSPGLDFHAHAMAIYKDELYAAGGYMNFESDTIGKEMILKTPLAKLKK